MSDTLSVPLQERQRIESARAALELGAGGVAPLLAMRTDTSWAVRREVVAALGALGDAAGAPLCASLVSERDDETRIAATVDALSVSSADVDRLLAPLVPASSAAVLADVAQILGRRRNTASVPLLARLSKHEDDNVAVAAIEGLGRVGGRGVVDVLVEAVQSGRFFRTFAAIDVLGRSGDPRAVAPLAALLDNAHYTFEAARALGRTHDRAAVVPLARLSSSRSDASTRVAALALAELHGEHQERFGTAAPIDLALRRALPGVAVRRLDQAFNGASVPEQVAICVVLGALGDERALPTLMRAVDAGPVVAAAAAAALKGTTAGASSELGGALLEDNSGRRRAILPIIDGAGSAAHVVACLADEDPEVRSLACAALARIGDTTAVPALFELLKDARAGVVRAATSALQSLGGAVTLELALKAASNVDAPGVRRSALRILSYFGHEPALDVLIAAAHDVDPRVREVAIAGLSLLDAPGALAALLELAEDPAPETRAVALRALGDTSSDAAVIERLTRALADAAPWARYYACQALGKLQATGAAASIVRLLDDEAGQVRVAAIEALSHLQSDVAFSALQRAARAEEADVRRAALIGLGLSRRSEALPLLAEQAAQADAATRLVALAALSELDGPESLGALRRAVDDDDENVRTAAVGFLGARQGADVTRLLVDLLAREPLGARVQHALSARGQHRVPGLLAALQTADDELAVRLTTILARLNQPEATAALFEALTLPNAPARKAAATTLVAAGKPHTYGALQQLALTDPDPEVRRVCALLLAQ